MLLRLFAPFLPFVTEEVWSWYRDGSIHRSAWPDSAPLRAAAGDAVIDVYSVAAEVLGAVRKAKSEARRSMRADVDRVVVRDTAHRLSALAAALDDVREAGRVATVETDVADTPAVEVELAESDAA